MAGRVGSSWFSMIYNTLSKYGKTGGVPVYQLGTRGLPLNEAEEVRLQKLDWFSIRLDLALVKSRNKVATELPLLMTQRGSRAKECVHVTTPPLGRCLASSTNVHPSFNFYKARSISYQLPVNTTRLESSHTDDCAVAIPLIFTSFVNIFPVTSFVPTSLNPLEP